MKIYKIYEINIKYIKMDYIMSFIKMLILIDKYFILNNRVIELCETILCSININDTTLSCLKICYYVQKFFQIYEISFAFAFHNRFDQLRSRQRNLRHSEARHLRYHFSYQA